MMDFYVDGKFKNSTVLQTGDLYMIEEGGELVVGQDQDCMLGCYQVSYWQNLQYTKDSLRND